MPYYSIDEQAERDHDPSFAEKVAEDEAEQEPTAALDERAGADLRTDSHSRGTKKPVDGVTVTGYNNNKSDRATARKGCIKMKRYGDTKTSLALTDKAQSAYSNSDPCDIYETDDGVFSVDICGDRRDGLAAEEVNAMLEELADEIDAANVKTYRVKAEFLDLWGNDSGWCANPIVTAEDIKNAAAGWGMSVEELLKQVDEIE